MSLLSAVAAVVLALLGQATLGRIWPEAHRYVDLMLVAVVWYGIGHAQRGTMLVGCVGGLLHDAWFQLGAFGTEGFKKTLLGWILGLIAVRIDLNHALGRFATGGSFALADVLAGQLVPRLVDRPTVWPGMWPLAVRVLTTGLLVALIGGIVDRRRRRRTL